jgi:hypothetical protein
MAAITGCAPSEKSLDSSAATGSVTGESEVQAFLESYYAAFSDRDWPRFESHFWPGATMTTIWTPTGEVAERVVVTSIPDFVAQAPQGPGSREIFEERLVSTRITIQGGLAQAWTRYHARFGDPGDIVEWEGLDAFTLLRHEGEWRVTSLAYLSDPE